MSKGIVGDPVSRGLLNGVNEGTTPLERPTLNRVRITDTGAKNDYALDSTAVSPITGFAYIEWNGASSVTFTGFAAGRDGEVRRIRNITAAQAMLFTHQAAGSTAANRLRTPGSVSTQAIGPGGTVDIVYNSADSRWELVILDEGDWISVAYSAGNFTAPPTTWTVDAGDQAIYRYKQRGTRLTLQIQIQTSSLTAGTAGDLRVTLPNSLVIGTGATHITSAFGIDNGTAVIADVRHTGGNAYFHFRRTDGTNWAASTNATYVGITTDLVVA